MVFIKNKNKKLIMIKKSFYKLKFFDEYVGEILIKDVL